MSAIKSSSTLPTIQLLRFPIFNDFVQIIQLNKNNGNYLSIILTTCTLFFVRKIQDPPPPHILL